MVSDMMNAFDLALAEEKQLLSDFEAAEKKLSGSASDANDLELQTDKEAKELAYHQAVGDTQLIRQQIETELILARAAYRAALAGEELVLETAAPVETTAPAATEAPAPSSEPTEAPSEEPSVPSEDSEQTQEEQQQQGELEYEERVQESAPPVSGGGGGNSGGSRPGGGSGGSVNSLHNSIAGLSSSKEEAPAEEISVEDASVAAAKERYQAAADAALHVAKADEAWARERYEAVETAGGSQGEINTARLIWEEARKKVADCEAVKAAADKGEILEISCSLVQTVDSQAGLSVEGLLQGGWAYLGIGLAVAFIISILICRISNIRRHKKQEKERRRKHRRAQEKHSGKAVAAPAEAAADSQLYTTMGEGVTSVGVTAGATLPLSGIRAMGFQGLGARNDQQDSFGVSNVNNYAAQGVMAVVADGMGGLANGKAVSAALVNTFQGSFNEAFAAMRPQDVLLNLALRSNTQVNQMLQNADRSGSTLVSALVRGGMLHFLTVGDSRIYLYRNGVLLQLNREHIYQEELAVKAVNYQVPVAQVTADRQAHSLTSYFGIGVIPHIDRNDEGIKLVPGDRILLCTDGVFGTLTREQMENALRMDLQEAAVSMKESIVAAGKPHQDNNTGLILEFLG